MTGASAGKGEEEYVMPSAEAMLGATLALMTGHGQTCCDGHRILMTKKILANLFYLAENPSLSPPFKTMLWNLRERWREQLEAAPGSHSAQAGPGLWHASPSAIQ
jgi:hypothetical protein